MLLETNNAVICGTTGILGVAQVEDERAVVARFVARVNSLGPLSNASLGLRARLLEEVKIVGRRIDGSAEAGAESSYERRVLHEDPSGWTLAAIILRPDQHTHPHDHGGWGCAVTVQGVESNRRFLHDDEGNLVLSGERDYPPGTGHVFDSSDVHQPVGADPHQVTVALHFLFDESHAAEHAGHQPIMLRPSRAGSHPEQRPSRRMYEQLDDIAA